MNPILIAQLMLVHFIADFCFQNDWMAQGKSKTFVPLMTHCLVYGLTFLVFFNIHFACFLIVTHYIVDYITSRITAPMFKEWYAYQKTDVAAGPVKVMEAVLGHKPPSLHNFFVVIGFDQWLHLVTILLGVFIYNLK